jgi:polyribonucleotide nucleotidyltransferase
MLERVPLLRQVDYVEGASSKGRLPEGQNRRDRVSDQEILAARAIDRAIRPLFPPGFSYETHVRQTI